MNAAVSEAIMEKQDSTAVDHDVIVAVTAKIEGMDKEALKGHIPDLLETVDFNYFELGLALAKYQEEEWWQEDGYGSFRDSIEEPWREVIVG